MYILDFGVTDVFNSRNLGAFTKFSRSGFAKKIIGRVLSQPLFCDVEEREMEKLNTGNKSGFNPLKALKDNFAWGDIFSIFGLGLLVGHHYFFGANENKGIIDKLFLWGTGIISAGGFILARFGQILGLDRQAALGNNFWKFLIEEGQNKTGKKVLEELDNKTLVDNAKRTRDLLVYPRLISSQIHERHTSPKGLVGFFSGSFGTGKTEGVKLILGNWVEQIEKEGKKAKVLQLNAGHLTEILERVKNDQLISSEDLSEFGLAGAESANETLMSFVYLIGKCKEEIVKAKTQGCELTIFIDEFEKILDLKKLQGCDKNKVTSLLIEFNKLFEGDFKNLIVTSNKTKEELKTELKEIIDQGALGAYLSRLPEVEVPIPDASTQAEMISTYIFNKLISENLIKLDNFDFGGANVNNISELTTLLIAHSQANGNYLSNGLLAGREIERAILQLPGHLTNLRKRTSSDKKLTLEDIKDHILFEFREKSKLFPEMTAQGEVKQKAYSIIQKFIEQNKDAVLKYYADNKQNKQKVEHIELIKHLYKHSDSNRDSLYTEKNDPKVDHGILIKDNFVTIAFKDVEKHDGNPFRDITNTDKIDLKEFESMIAIELAKYIPKERNFLDFLNEVLGTAMSKEVAETLLPLAAQLASGIS